MIASPVDKRWRDDGKCGESYLLADGILPAQCDPDGDNPCCDSNGQCGRTPEQCLCYECTDFSIIYRQWRASGGLQKWRYDRRCGSSFPLPDGSSAECDPEGHSPCCNHDLGKCGNTAEGGGQVD